MWCDLGRYHNQKRAESIKELMGNTENKVLQTDRNTMNVDTAPDIVMVHKSYFTFSGAEMLKNG